MPSGRAANNRIDLRGERFGKLVVDNASYTKGKFLYWRCVCDCGGIVSVRANSLRNGGTRSCGCIRQSIRKSRFKTHGMSGSKTYVTWERMKSRCYYEKDINYKNYGAIGITVCDEWIGSFEKFLDDMGERPAGTFLERIDNSQGYYPENCRWATKKEQGRNKRNNIVVELFGKKMVLSELSEETGVKYSTLYKRIVIKKMPPELAI